MQIHRIYICMATLVLIRGFGYSRILPFLYTSPAIFVFRFRHVAGRERVPILEQLLVLCLFVPYHRLF